MSLIADKYITVREFDNDVDTGIDLKNNDWLDISVGGSIWAGVWFTGQNGPNGWPGHQANNDSSLPGAAPYSMLGKTAEDGYFLIGAGLRRTYLNGTIGPGQTRLYLKINDDRPGNGSGSFLAHIRIWRN